MRAHEARIAVGIVNGLIAAVVLWLELRTARAPR